MKEITIPYGRQTIDELDIEAVTNVLRSNWLTTGPAVSTFENGVKNYVGVNHGVAVSSGTAALHCAMKAIGIGKGDEVIVPTMTFAATANAVVFEGGTPVFADVDPDTLLIDEASVESLITPKTKAVVAVDFAGQPCDYGTLRRLADERGIVLVSDACHALGAEYDGRKVGALADITLFSFHPVKHITTGEGGMAVTADKTYADTMFRFRNHGITSDFRDREEKGSWYYEMVDLGYNYRISDLQCALGTAQLSRLDEFIKRRQQIAHIYDRHFAAWENVTPLTVKSSTTRHAFHLYVVKLSGGLRERDEVFRYLRKRGIGVNLHYIPVHLHPFYKKRFGYDHGLCPSAEDAYKTILTLPVFPGLSDNDVETVVSSLKDYVK